MKCTKGPIRRELSNQKWVWQTKPGQKVPKQVGDSVSLLLKQCGKQALHCQNGATRQFAPGRFCQFPVARMPLGSPLHPETLLPPPPRAVSVLQSAPTENRILLE